MMQWMSPEVIAGKSYEESADIYSLGMVFWETLTGLCPFDGMSQIEVAMSVVQKGLRPTIPNTCNAALVNLLRACWSFVPTERPSAIDVLSALEEALPNIE
jgi:serine/threonine protein kinase